MATFDDAEQAAFTKIDVDMMEEVNVDVDGKEDITMSNMGNNKHFEETGPNMKEDPPAAAGDKVTIEKISKDTALVELAASINNDISKIAEE